MQSLIARRFRLGGLLGSGGSASVFRATDVTTGDQVALKLLHPHLSETPGQREAFLREARAVRALQHANAVTVIDIGIDEDAERPVAWIALEYIDGPTLSEAIAARGALTAADAVTVTLGVLAAVGAAHSEGIVHRDVTPGNVMLVAGEGALTIDRVRLLDFGLADAVGRSSVGSDVLRTDADQPAGVIASVSYASPEQLRGEPVDERGDLYQVGGVLHFALTGRPPFQRPTAAETARAHLEAPPPVASVLDSRIPKALDRIVVKAMLKDPEDRFGSAAEMAAALQIVASPAASVPGPVTTTRRYRTTAATAVMAGTADVSGTARGHPYLPALTRAADPVGPTPLTSITPASPRSNAGAWATGIIAVAIVAGIVAFTAAGQPVAPPSAMTSSSSPAVETPQTSAPVESDAEDTVAVPELIGTPLARVRDLLQAAGLAVGGLTVVDSAQPGDTVLDGAPGAGTRVRPGSTVDLVVASGANLVPVVVGLSPADATMAAQAAGFTVTLDPLAPDRAGQRIAVTQPAAGTRLRLGSNVTIFIAEPSATPTPTPTAPPMETPTSTPTAEPG